MLPPFLQLIPEYRAYLWGGQHLRPGQHTAEAWVIYEHDRIANGPWASRTLAEVSLEAGGNLLGQRALQRSGTRFPLLIKLLDCAQWLSLQVHPNDEQAQKLEGAGQFGKTEAWHILAAEPGAQIIAGLKPGTTPEALAQAVYAGTILDLVQYLPLQSGDTVFMPAGMIHALGPGLLVYEVQQTSDLTYRVFDWNRPQTGGRVLHIEKSLAVANATLTGSAVPRPSLQDGESAVLCRCDYFTLELLNASVHVMRGNTQGESFHALTVVSGTARLIAGGETCTLSRFESAVIPAATGPYELQPLEGFQALRARV